MSIEPPATVEKHEAAAITDLTAEEVGETQLALVAEIVDSPAALPVNLETSQQRSASIRSVLREAAVR